MRLPRNPSDGDALRAASWRVTGFGARELPAAGRTRVARQPLNRRDHPIMNVAGQPAQVFFGGAFQ